MTSKERLKVVLNGGVPDRVPVCEVSIWEPTFDRWHKEGMPEDIDYNDYFGLDKIGIIPFNCSLQFKKETVEETEEYIIEKDEFGATVKSWKMNYNYAPPLHIDYSIKTMEDWQIVKERLKATGDRIWHEASEDYKNLKEKGTFTVITPMEPVWAVLQHALGFDRTLTAMVEDIDFVNDMLATYTDFVIDMCELCAGKGMEFDALWFFSDLCYKNGMLFSPRVYREVIMPYHKRIAGFCKAHKWPLILHCDGDVREFIPLLIEAGFRGIQPLEARCGNDVRELKRLYGTKIVFFGNISADILSRSRKEIEEEVRTKVSIGKENGGYIYHSDHSIPPTVSLENYKYTIEAVKRCGKY